MATTLEEKAQRANQAIHHLLENYKTASLATVDGSGAPIVSYAPVAVDSERRFYLFVSELADHTANLIRGGPLSLLLMEDECRSKLLFARSRLTLTGPVTHIGRRSERWADASSIYGRRFGKFFDQLVTLPDFHMFCLEPHSARIVVGFGIAFEIGLPDWSSLTLITGK